jgi:dTMP kinase
MSTARGQFWVLDGIDGCGKSSQAQRLVERLERGGQRALHLREPGGTALGERLRELLLDPSARVSAAVEALLFAAARRALLDERVEPSLARGEWVVCERFHASTFAYQACAGGLDQRSLLDLLQGWAGRPRPDGVLILDLDAEAARARRGADRDRIEKRGLEFQRQVRDGYLRYAAIEPRARIVDARGPIEEVAERVWREVQRGAA